MVNRIKIANHAQRSSARAEQKILQIALSDTERLSGARQRNNRDSHSHDVSEKTFLHNRDIPCKTDKQTHQRKAERRTNDADNTHHILIYFFVYYKVLRRLHLPHTPISFFNPQGYLKYPPAFLQKLLRPFAQGTPCRGIPTRR